MRSRTSTRRRMRSTLPTRTRRGRSARKTSSRRGNILNASSGWRGRTTARRIRRHRTECRSRPIGCESGFWRRPSVRPTHRKSTTRLLATRSASRRCVCACSAHARRTRAPHTRTAPLNSSLLRVLSSEWLKICTHSRLLSAPLLPPYCQCLPFASDGGAHSESPPVLGLPARVDTHRAVLNATPPSTRSG